MTTTTRTPASAGTPARRTGTCRTSGSRCRTSSQRSVARCRRPAGCSELLPERRATTKPGCPRQGPGPRRVRGWCRSVGALRCGPEGVAVVRALGIEAADRPVVVVRLAALAPDLRPGELVSGVGDQSFPGGQKRAPQRDVRTGDPEVGRTQAGRLQFTLAALGQLRLRVRCAQLPRERSRVDAAQALHVVSVLVGERVEHPGAT